MFLGSVCKPTAVFSAESVRVNTYLCWQDRLVTGSAFWCKNPRVKEEVLKSYLKLLQKVHPRELF